MGLMLFRREQTDSAPRPVVTTVEEILVELTRYGKPRLSYMGDGWYSSIEMNTNSDGVAFKVDSDFKMGTPLMAVTQCRERMYKAISQYKE